MSINKPSLALGIWAANPTQSATPTSGKVNEGWDVETPPREWQNWWQNRVDEFIFHINTNGWAGWAEFDTYNVGDVCELNNKGYMSLVANNTGILPSTDVANGNGNWKELSTYENAKKVIKDQFGDGHSTLDDVQKRYIAPLFSGETARSMSFSNDGLKLNVLAYSTPGTNGGNSTMNSFTLTRPFDLTSIQSSSAASDDRTSFNMVGANREKIFMTSDAGITSATGYDLATPGDAASARTNFTSRNWFTIPADILYGIGAPSASVIITLSGDAGVNRLSAYNTANYSMNVDTTADLITTASHNSLQPTIGTISSMYVSNLYEGSICKIYVTFSTGEIKLYYFDVAAGSIWDSKKVFTFDQIIGVDTEFNEMVDGQCLCVAPDLRDLGLGVFTVGNWYNNTGSSNNRFNFRYINTTKVLPKVPANEA